MVSTEVHLKSDYVNIAEQNMPAEFQELLQNFELQS